MQGFFERKLGLIVLTAIITAGLFLISFSSNTRATDLKLDSGKTATGSISGHVYRADGMTPISGALVDAVGANNQHGISTSDSAGSYSIQGLVSDNYLISVEASGYLKEYYDNTTSSATATTVSVIAPNIISNIDFTLDLGGSISGHVYQADGITPISGVRLTATNTSIHKGPVYTDSNGKYFLNGLATDTYRITASADGYLPQYFKGVYFIKDVTPVSVSAPYDTPNIDFNLETAVPVIVNISNTTVASSGRDFVVRINVSEVWELSAFQFDLMYDPAVIRMDNVTSGRIGSTILPVDMWRLIPEDRPGTLRALGHVSAIDGLTGSGYLAEIHFHVLGSPGQNSALTFSNGFLFDAFIDNISPVTWENGSVQVSSRGDVNLDSRVSMGDVTKLERMILGLDPLNPLADVNQDGSINIGDVTKLERILLGLDWND